MAIGKSFGVLDTTSSASFCGVFRLSLNVLGPEQLDILEAVEDPDTLGESLGTSVSFIE